MIFVGAVLDHDLVAGVGVGLIPLSYFHILLLAVRTRHGLYVNAAVADIVNIRKGRGCNGRNNRHDGCCRQHPQSQIFSLHTNPPCCTFKACPAAKRIPRSPPHGGHPGVSFPLFAPTRHRSFPHFTPPPIPFSIAIIYKVSPFYLFTFCRAGNAKTPFPCRSRQRKGVFMPRDGRGGQPLRQNPPAWG